MSVKDPRGQNISPICYMIAQNIPILEREWWLAVSYCRGNRLNGNTGYYAKPTNYTSIGV